MLSGRVYEYEERLNCLHKLASGANSKTSTWRSVGAWSSIANGMQRCPDTGGDQDEVERNSSLQSSACKLFLISRQSHECVRRLCCSFTKFKKKKMSKQLVEINSRYIKTKREKYKIFCLSAQQLLLFFNATCVAFLRRWTT